MRYAHTVEQVRAAEETLLASQPEGALMQRAAHGLAYAVLDLLGSAYGRRVLLLVGPGNNGGDALYAGAVLARRGCAVEAWLVTDQTHPGGLDALRAAGGRVVGPSELPGALSGLVPEEARDEPSRRTRPDRAELVVDGILGIGGRPGLPDAAIAALEHLQGIPMVAVDTPSGVDVDTGETPEPHVHADVTVTFGTHKVAHLVDPAASACGVVQLVDLGLELPPAMVESLQPADVTALLPRPGGDAHKYTRGVVGIRAGSAAYPGAGLLSVAGAASGLCGMVRYVGDADVAARVRTAHPEVVGEGQVQAWVVGSGSGADAARELDEALRDGVPTVVDADALAHVTGPLSAPAVLTPHAGELSRMLDVPRATIEAAPLAHARAAAERYAAVVLLKGRHTLVAAPGGRVRVTTTGTPWLATAGAGDVLGGLIGALLAADLDPFDAASVGSWLHGAAATLAGGGGPLTAGRVAEAIPDAVRRMGQSTT